MSAFRRGVSKDEPQRGCHAVWFEVVKSIGVSYKAGLVSLRDRGKSFGRSGKSAASPRGARSATGGPRSVAATGASGAGV